MTNSNRKKFSDLSYALPVDKKIAMRAKVLSKKDEDSHDAWFVELSLVGKEQQYVETVKIPRDFSLKGGESFLEAVEQVNQKYAENLDNLWSVIQRYYFAKLGEKVDDSLPQNHKKALLRLFERSAKDIFLDYALSLEYAANMPDVERMLDFLKRDADKSPGHQLHYVRDAIDADALDFPMTFEKFENDLREHRKYMRQHYRSLVRELRQKQNRYADPKLSDQSREIIDRENQSAIELGVALNDLIAKFDEVWLNTAISLRFRRHIPKAECDVNRKLLDQALDETRQIYNDFKRDNSLLSPSKGVIEGEKEPISAMDMLDDIEVLLDDLDQMAGWLCDPHSAREKILGGRATKSARTVRRDGGGRKR